MSTILLYLAFVGAVFAALQGCAYFVADLREETRSEMSQLRRARLADGLSPWLRDLLLTTPIRRFDNLVQTCGLKVRTEYILLGMLFATVVSAMITNYVLPNPVLGLVLGVFLGIVLPLGVIAHMRTRRMNKLTLQLPEALGMMVRTLRAGHPIAACIGMVAREMPDPIGSEFKRVADAMLFNLSLRDALSRLSQRLHTVHELRYLVTAIRIQTLSGGNLAEILDSLAGLMREQQKLKMKIKAFSAEGRLSANVLAVMPVGIFVIINVLNPNLYRDAFSLNKTAVTGVLAGAAILLVVGFIFARRVVKIRV